MEKAFYDKTMIEAFSSLPGKNQLIAMLMSAMNGPIQNLVYALNAVPTKLVRTLKAVEEQKAWQRLNFDRRVSSADEPAASLMVLNLCGRRGPAAIIRRTIRRSGFLAVVLSAF